MRGGKPKRARGHLSRGALLSLLLHAHLLVLVLVPAWILGGREEARGADGAAGACRGVAPEGRPRGLPALDPRPRAPRERRAPPRRAPKKKPTPTAPLAKERPPASKPEPEVVVPPLPPMPEP